MAWWNSLKDLTHDIGHVTSEVGKVAGYVPGVGPLAGGLLTAAGGVIEGDPLKDALINGAKAGVTQYGVGKLAGSIPGLSGVVRKLPVVGSLLGGSGGSGSGAPGGIPGTSSDPSTWDPMDPGSYLGGGSSGGSAGGDWANASAGGSQGVDGSGGGTLDALYGAARKLGLGGAGGSSGGFDLGSFLGNHAGDLALGGLATAQGVMAANASKRAGELSNKAIDLANTNWAAGAPLRTQGQTSLLNPTRPDLSATYADPTNPFASRPRKLAVPS
jgi:hypothetical protein